MTKDCGHGWVYPRKDGSKARCGGPKMCKACQRDQEQQRLADDPSARMREDGTYFKPGG